MEHREGVEKTGANLSMPGRGQFFGRRQPAWYISNYSLFTIFAAMTKPELVPVPLQEIQIGVPLPFAVFDAHHTLLLAEGQLVQAEPQLTALQEIGLFRARYWHQAESGHGTGTGSPIRTFAQLRLQPGSTLCLRRSDLPPHGFVAVKLLGWSEDEDLLVSAMTQCGMELTLPVGVPLEIKLLAGKGIVSFQSAIRQACHAPYPYLHLAYPQELAIRQLRRSLRASVSLPARVSGGRDAASYDGMLATLSASGGMLALPLLFAQIGDELLLMLSLQLADQEHRLVLRSVVRNMHTHTEVGHVPMVCYGLEFLDAATAERLVIEQFILQNLLEN